MAIRRRYDLPPQPDMELPLLWFIARQGGTIRASNCKDEVQEELAGIFHLAKEKLDEATNGGEEGRWWNHIRHVVRMLRENGHLSPVVGTGTGSGRGFWSITSKGWQYLWGFVQGRSPVLTILTLQKPATTIKLHTEFVEWVRQSHNSRRS